MKFGTRVVIYWFRWRVHIFAIEFTLVFILWGLIFPGLTPLWVLGLGIVFPGVCLAIAGILFWRYLDRYQPEVEMFRQWKLIHPDAFDRLASEYQSNEVFIFHDEIRQMLESRKE